jgi:hypothetical protein
MELVRFVTAGGTSVLIESDDAPGGYQKAGVGDRIAQARRLFEDGIGDITDAAESAMNVIRSRTRRPDDVTIEFGVNLLYEHGAVIAKAGIGANLKVTLRWAAPAPAAEPGSPPA